MTNIFPLGIATGDAFCNRIEKRAMLQANMLHSRHTLIVMTRRYGKSSLLAQIFQDTAKKTDHHLMGKLSLLTAYDVDGVLRIIRCPPEIVVLLYKRLPRKRLNYSSNLKNEGNWPKV